MTGVSQYPRQAQGERNPLMWSIERILVLIILVVLVVWLVTTLL